MEVRNLTVRIHKFTLQDINLRVEAGECLVIVGPNGAGKTTLLETIAGLYRPIRGRILIDGKDVTDLPPEKRNIGYLPQDLVLFPHLTVDENIAFGPKQVKGSEIRELMNKLNIAHLSGRSVKSLSGGERQKVCLARALIRRPKVLLLDEPLPALDVRTKDMVRRELKKIQTEAQLKYGISSIYVTHDPAEAYMMGDKIAIMEEGVLRQIGTKEEVMNGPKSKFVAEFMGLNVFEGKVTGYRDGFVNIEVSGIKLISSNDGIKGKRALIVIRPEDVDLIKDGSVNYPSSNRLSGEVIEVLETRYITRVLVDIGFPLRVEMETNKLASKLKDVKVGDRVTVNFEPKSVYLAEYDGETPV